MTVPNSAMAVGPAVLSSSVFGQGQRAPGLTGHRKESGVGAGGGCGPRNTRACAHAHSARSHPAPRPARPWLVLCSGMLAGGLSPAWTASFAVCSAPSPAAGCRRDRPGGPRSHVQCALPPCWTCPRRLLSHTCHVGALACSLRQSGMQWSQGTNKLKSWCQRIL